MTAIDLDGCLHAAMVAASHSGEFTQAEMTLAFRRACATAEVLRRRVWLVRREFPNGVSELITTDDPNAGDTVVFRANP